MKKKSLFFSLDVDNVIGSNSAIESCIKFSKEENLHTSFFITGEFAMTYPIETKLIFSEGYDIGIHGWDHGHQSNENFSTNTYKEQRERVQKTMEAISNITGVSPIINRCPNLRISETTLRVLKEEGILLDSSVPSKRFVVSVKIFKFLFSPSHPYFPSFKNMSKQGNQTDLIEVPPSALLLPINLSALRYFGLNTMKAVVKIYSIFNDNIIFYGHPAEFLMPNEIDFMDENVERRHVENIGPHVFDLTREFIKYVKSLGYESRAITDLIHENSINHNS